MSCWLKESSTLLHKLHRKGPHLMREPRLNSLQLTIHSAQATNACERRRLFNLQRADIQQSPKHDTPIFAERSCLRLYQENNSVVDLWFPVCLPISQSYEAYWVFLFSQHLAVGSVLKNLTILCRFVHGQDLCLIVPRSSDSKERFPE